MQYRFLGRTGVEVSTLRLGAMNFGHVGNTPQEATAIVGALEAGINCIGSTGFSSGGHAEEMLDPALRRR